MSNGVTWDDSDLNSALARMRERIPDRTEEAITNICLAIEREAKERCPVHDGTLRRSITSDVQTWFGETFGKVGTVADYAPYVHEGTGIYARAGNGRKEVPWVYRDPKTGDTIATKGNKPQPFLEDAVEAVKPQLLQYFADLLKGV